MSPVTVGDLLAQVGERAPWWWAEPWDNVGLIAGDPTAPLERVYVSLDPTPAALDRAVEAGANVLLTHHPAFREGPARLVPGKGMAGVPYDAVRRGVALVAAHTNMDRCPSGAEALPERLGLTSIGPLEDGIVDAVVVAVYVPRDKVSAVRSAMAGAGAGVIGRYEGCSFASEGIGTFVAKEGASPAMGALGVPASTDESRLEMIAPPGAVDAVVAACRSAHPYEEPVILVQSTRLPLGAARMGRLCAAPESLSLSTIAGDVGRRLGVRPRVWGEPETPASILAIAPGSGRSFVDAALAAGADVFVTGELRYHDALDAVAAGLSVIEAGHDATEWPLVAALANIARGTEGIAPDGVVLDEPSVGWWVTCD